MLVLMIKRDGRRNGKKEYTTKEIVEGVVKKICVKKDEDMECCVSVSDIRDNGRN